MSGRVKKSGVAALAALLLCSLLLTGCWSRRELNDLALVMGLGIDRSDEGFRVTVQIIRPSRSSSQEGASLSEGPTVLFSANAGTLYEALRKLTRVSPRQVFFPHLRVVVFGESMAREGFDKAIDFMSRDYEFRSDYYLIVAKGETAERVLSSMTTLEEVPANSMFKALENSQSYWAPMQGITLDRLITDLAGEEQSAVLTGMEVASGQGLESKAEAEGMARTYPQERLKFDGLAVIKQAKLIGWLTEEESKGYNYIMNQVANSVGAIACPGGGTMTMEIVRTSTRVKVLERNGQPVIRVIVENEDNIADVECRVDLTSPAVIRELERITEEQLRGILVNSLRTAQVKYNADIFNFWSRVAKQQPQLWERIKGDWEEIFPKLQVEFDLDVKIRRIGKMTDPLLNRFPR